MSSLPVLAKSWQYVVNQQIAAVGTTLTCAQRLWRTIVATILAFGSNAPTCVGSCDSTTAALDGTNRWTADSKVVSATPGNAHSWFVFKMSTNAGANVQICIDVDSASVICPASVYLSVSAGFTGGTTTARPTATDEVKCASSVAFAANSNIQNVYHAMLSTDGTALRVLVYSGNTFQGVMFWEKPSSVSSWAVPFVVTHTTNALSYANCWASGSPWLTGRGPSGLMSLTSTTEANSAGALGQLMTVVDGIDGGFVFTPQGLYGTTAGMTGQHGRLNDIWFGSTTASTGDTYPNDSSKQFVQISNMVFPWNGTTLVTA